MSQPRNQPHSTEAEFHLLGGLLLDNEAYFAIAHQVDAEDLYHERHRILFEAIRDLLASNRAADPVTLFDRLKDGGKLEQIGGAQAIAELVDRVPTAANIEAHARLIREKAMLRRMIRTCGQIVEDSYGDVDSVGEFLDRAEQSVYDVSQGGRRDLTEGPELIRPLLRRTMEQLEARHRNKSDVTGVRTGFAELDRLTTGLHNGDLVILAARPAMGKTSLALNMAANAALMSEATVAVFSLEMPRDQLATRMLASEARVASQNLRTGHFSETDASKLVRALEVLGKTNIHIDDTPGSTPVEIRGKCRRIKSRGDLGLIIIDYLQLMRLGRRSESRQNEIAEISRTLKEMAKSLQVPVVALSQLNRELEKRQSKRPLLSDLRESGSIEQDADLIMFIYRDEVYNENTAERGTAEVIISKHRNGPTGTVKLKFWNQYTRFDNLEQRGDTWG